MLEMFREKSEVSALEFFNANADDLALLVAPGFYKKINALHPDVSVEDLLKCDVLKLGNVQQVLAKREKRGDRRTHVVADHAGEAKRVAQLRKLFPKLSFAGLGEAVFPAIVTRQATAALRPMPTRLKCHTIVLIFATPRSGSSLVADILADLGLGDTREHLRGDEITALASSYLFSRRAALRNLVNLSANDGAFSTKIISHFLINYMREVRDFRPLKIFGPKVKVKAIVLDRTSKVDQAVSADVAMQRGIWHVRSGADAEKVKTEKTPKYVFERLNSRYFEYRQQSFILDFAREMFPDHLALDYESDIAGVELGMLGGRIAKALDLKDYPTDFARSRARQKIANEDNTVLARQFRKDFNKAFGFRPK
ncbi:Stf0 family sulfotransferase [Roseovarius sp.]|uniref:Stf0 family sulfotransferase n=1 Tax=Roseovarius sp. TaxID=1486281 RepID=UPI002630BDBD|nr:Stf0 family sulfotransferase [Roseovarius sp.]MDM8167593.1 Stf0 family sulfotransferase [Roseovarius sp.]